MTREEAIAEAIRQGCSAVDAQAVGSSLPEDCSFRTPGFSGPAIIVSRCGMLAKARADFARADRERWEAFVDIEALSVPARSNMTALASAALSNAAHRLNNADDELADCRARLDDMLKDYGIKDIKE